MVLIIGNVYEGKIVNVTNFGVFVEINNSITGLVHISEISNEYVKDIKEYLGNRKTVKVKVLSIDPGGRVGLSIKQAEDVSLSNGVRGNELNFEDILSKYLKDSEERMQDFKKNQDFRCRNGKRKFG